MTGLRAAEEKSGLERVHNALISSKPRFEQAFVTYPTDHDMKTCSGYALHSAFMSDDRGPMQG